MMSSFVIKVVLEKSPGQNALFNYGLECECMFDHLLYYDILRYMMETDRIGVYVYSRE